MITKSDICWVVVRAAGLYLIYAALSGAFTLLLAQIAARDLARNLPHPIGPEESSLVPSLIMTASIALPLALGIYLVLSGRSVHRCLMAAPIPGPVRKRWMGMEGAELAEFYNWLGRNPEFESLAAEDQVARFRDASRPSH